MMKIILKSLINAGLRLKKSKCALMQDSVQYLRHRIDAQGVHTIPDKIAAKQKLMEAPILAQLAHLS